MSYSKVGRRPFEYASKAAHHHIINDAEVQRTIRSLWIPPAPEEESVSDKMDEFTPVLASPIKNVVAVDGGYQEVLVREKFPTAMLHFFQFGALLFRREDLQRLDKTPFIAPEDMATLKNIERLKFALPTKGVRREDLSTLKDTIRQAVYNFFRRETLGEDSSLLDTLAWFVFRGYKRPAFRATEDDQWLLSSNPLSPATGAVTLLRKELRADCTFKCPETGGVIYLTDVFRLHELVDEELGATGLSAYLSGAIEHLIILHILRQLIRVQPERLREVLFVLDRPTGFFGQTARLHVLMNEFVCWALQHHGLFLVGLEKSGAFVDHAREIAPVMEPSSMLILGDKYIYKYIAAGQEDLCRPYASTSYYGQKVIFKAGNGQMYVVSVPVRHLQKEPTKADLPNLDVILTHVEEMRCDMYDSALIPIALANKLVSLSAHPSSKILQAFATSSIQ